MEQWSSPASPEVSFFKPTSSNDNAHDDEDDSKPSRAARATIIFQLPFPAVYNVLRFLGTKTVFTSFFPSCRGFAEIVQSIPLKSWADRLLEAMYPQGFFAQMGDHQHEMMQLRNRVRQELHMSICFAIEKHQQQQQQQQQQPRESSRHDDSAVVFPFTLKKVLPAIRFYEDEDVAAEEVEDYGKMDAGSGRRFQHERGQVSGSTARLNDASCHVCHGVNKFHFVVRRRSHAMENGDQVLPDWFEFSRCYTHVRAFLLRGDSAPPDMPLQRLPEHLAEEEKEGTKKDGDDNGGGGGGGGGGEEAEQQPHLHVVPAAVHGAVGGILFPFTWNYLVKRDEAHFQNLSASMADLKARVVEADGQLQLALGSGRTKYFDGVDATTDVLMPESRRCRGCGGLGSVAASTAAPTWGILGHSLSLNLEEDRGSSSNSNRNTSTTAQFHVARAPPPPGPVLRGILSRRRCLPQHEVEYFALLSSATLQSVRTLHFASEVKRATLSRVTNPITLGSIELRFFFSYRHETSGRLLSQLLACPSNSGFTDVMANLFDDSNGEHPDLMEIFILGYGRVEVDKVPKILIKHLARIADEILGLSPGFPLGLLWNILLVASGAVIDLLPHVDSLRVHHHVPLRNWFEENSVLDEQ